MKQSGFMEHTLGQLRPVIFYAAIISCFISLLILPMSLYSLQVFDRVMSTGGVETLIWLTIITTGIFAAAGVLQSLRGMVMARAADWLYRSIAKQAIPISLSHIAVSSASKNIQSLRDASMLRQFLGGAGFIALLDAPWAILSILLMFVIHPALGALTVVGAGLLVLLAWINELTTRASTDQISVQQISAMHDLEVAARNTDVVEAMGMSSTIVERWHQSQQNMMPYQEEVNRRSSNIQGITKFVRLTLQILVTALAAWLALGNSTTMGAIIAASILSSRALSPFEAAIASWKGVGEARGAYARLKAVLTQGHRQEDINLPAPEGRVSVENVFYAAPDQSKAILRNVGFSLEPGESLGIVGPSGSGKTTLARLLTGTWKPNSGHVRLDDADVYSWPRKEFGKYIGYMPQDVELFSGTVKDNIARLQQEVDEEKIIEAAQLANAHELILRLPKGYSTDVGVNGESLSAGQRQRIGLARSFFGMPRLLVLDEPDSNLDDAGQAALLQALQYAKSYSITVIVITHRKSVLQHVDKLLYLRDGVAEAFGKTADVVAKLASPARSAKVAS